ncbi:MAG: hypothetical protein HBSAPP03_07480 [Phycisphaerae bacterium]|nr:MAG: hypothetical protein HBSAPP03_07480 [Phycisphaerae bacterium]
MFGTRLLLVGVCGGTMMLGGCVAAAVGAAAGVGTYAYVTGKLTATVDGSLDDAFDASVKAVNKLEFANVDSRKDVFQGWVTCTMADKTDVRIDLKKLTDTSTEVRIRVGVFGDEKKSVLILDTIRDNL